jgi:predicted transcriptional regulator
MSLSETELELLACLFRKQVIGKSHRRVDSIAGLCHIRSKKGFKKLLKRLVAAGYLQKWHGPAYSLTREGVQAAKDHLGL